MKFSTHTDKVNSGFGHIFLVALVFMFFAVGCTKEEIAGTSAQNLPDLTLTDDYVGALVCSECHAEAHDKWKESHHFHAMELPN